MELNTNGSQKRKRHNPDNIRRALLDIAGNVAIHYPRYVNNMPALPMALSVNIMRLAVFSQF
jgi:hypothetical protein